MAQVVPLSWLKSLASTCTSLGLLLHCDGEDDHEDDHVESDDGEDYDNYDDDDDDDCYEGARLLHSSTALGIGPDRLLEGFNSSTLCLRWMMVMMMMTKKMIMIMQ